MSGKMKLAKNKEANNMKRTILSIALIGALSLTSAIGLSACKTPDGEGDVKSKDVYAMSVVSSISYLSSDTQSSLMNSGYGENGNLLFTADVTRPTNIVDEDISGIKNCLATFDNIIAGGGIEQSIRTNTSTDPMFSGYTYEMTINLHDNVGNATPYTMYYNETSTNTETEIDDGIEETEVSTIFNGLVKFGEEFYVIAGEKEVETEGNETEYSIEFKTYKNENDFVIVSQSFENDEIEYEYEFYRNGRKVHEIELEYEEERNGVEVTFEIKDLTTGARRETEYTVRKGTGEETFLVIVTKNGTNDNITVKKQGSGYQFVYSNGFSEVIE